MELAPEAIPGSMYVSRGRAFGDDLAPPRPAYYLFIPSLLILVGTISWFLSNEMGFVLACAVATAVGGYTFWGWLFRKGPTRFSTLMAMALLLGYGAGALNTAITLPRGSLSLETVMGLGRGVLSRGIGAVLLSTAILYFVGEIYEKPIFGRDFHFSANARTRVLVVLGTLAILGGFAIHALGFQGASSVGGHLNPIGDFLDWLYTPLTAIAAIAFLTTPRGKGKIICGIAMLILLLMSSVMGRRVALYTVVEVLLAVELSGYSWKGSRMRKTIMIGALGAVVVICSLAFMLFRIAGWSVRQSGQVTVGKRVAVARKMIRTGGAVALAGSTTQKNLQSRTFVISYFANVLDASTRKTPMWGRNTIYQIQVAIPRLIDPGKDVSLSEEQMVNEAYGFGYGDQPNSILTAGAADFSLLGALIYPLLMVGLFRVVFHIMSKFLSLVPLMFVTLSLINAMLQTENTVSGYLGTLRAAPVFGLAIALVVALPSIRWAMPEERAGL